MKLKFTIEIEQVIRDLADYDATTLEEAVTNQQHWIDEGALDPYDLLGSDNIKITVTGVQS